LFSARARRTEHGAPPQSDPAAAPFLLPLSLIFYRKTKHRANKQATRRVRCVAREVEEEGGARGGCSRFCRRRRAGCRGREDRRWRSAAAPCGDPVPCKGPAGLWPPSRRVVLRQGAASGGTARDAGVDLRRFLALSMAAGALRAMCGSRTGGWSLPSVMSD
jgi:hypothetical protein